jgi:alpha-glucosidase
MNKRTRDWLIFVAAIALGLWMGRLMRPGNKQVSGALTFDPAQVPSAAYSLSNFILRWDAEAGQLTLEDSARPGFALWQTPPGEAFVLAAQGEETVSESRSMFTIRDRWLEVCNEQSIEQIEERLSEVWIRGTLFCGKQEVPYSLNFGVGSASMARFGVHLEGDPAFDRVFLTYASSPEERFFGFGEQFSYFDMKGKRVPIWVSEQGVGRGDQPITLGADLTNGGAGGDAFTTYAPIPFYLTSQMRAVSLTNSEYTVFDLERPDRVQVQVFSNELGGLVFSGETPQEILSAYSDHRGNPPPLPEWVYSGAIVGMQGGTEKVRQVYAELQARQVPIAAFWLQDWVGQRTTSFGKQLWWNWEVDYERYPGWEQLTSDLEQDGVRVMVYVSPYLADLGGLKPNLRRNLFQEAAEKGYLVKNQDGDPYLVLNTDFSFGMIDLSNPEAFAWYQQVILEQVVGAGASGWMADFGEGLPYDAVLFSGEAASFHNAYPAAWALLNRQVVEQSDGDLVFFHRAGFTQSPSLAALFWEGDQLVSWGKNDGIKSAVTGLNTGGLSGFAFNHSDIGGYTTVSNPIMTYHRSEELLLRWMEMNAFTLVFRTHEGNQPENNAQFYSDAAALDSYARWAKVYAALFEYRKTLVAEAARTGMPVIRHPFLHYPDDPQTWKITYQEFMLGADFLIAPVTEEGAKTVEVYLPAGEWAHLWSGETYAGGQTLSIAAPLGQPAVFYVKGSPWGETLVRTLETEGLMP